MIELRPTEFPVVAGFREWLSRMGYEAEYGSAVLERNNPGRVFVDSHRDPSATLVWSRSGYCFLLGKPSGRFLAALNEVLFGELDHNVMRLLTFEQETTQLLREALGPTTTLENLQSFDWDPTHQNGSVTTSLPPGTELRPISGPLIERLMSFKPFIRRFWGDAQQFAAHGFGFCVLAQGMIISECHSAWVGGGVHEVGVETADSWRRRGLARACAAAFVKESQQRGGRPSWHCPPANQASVALAHLVGFVPGRKLDMLVWHRNQSR